MRRAILILGFLLPAAAWPDTVHFDTGRVVRGVKVASARQTTTGALVLLHTTRATTPTLGVGR